MICFTSWLHCSAVFYILVLLLCLFVDGVFNANCLARREIFPCVCQEKTKGVDIQCSDSGVDRLKDVFRVLSGTGQSIVYLRLKGNDFHTLESDFLIGLDIKHLVAYNCSISHVDHQAFDGLGDKLESLDLSQNRLIQVPTKSLSNLTSLVSLSLDFNEIETIHGEAFKGLISLLRLSLYGNKIKVIDGGAFLGMGGNITRINLGNNLLTLIPSESLANLTTLKRLQLHENKIATLKTQEFKGTSAAASLDYLNLATNLLEEVPERAFENLATLNLLDLEKNSISFIHPEAFEGVEDSLEWVMLGDNLLGTIPSSSLKKLTKLRQLDLRGNNISKVPEDSFRYFGGNLKFLFLQKNQIKTIEDGAFSSLISLEWLYLHSNELTTLSNNLFHRVLESLKVLDVHDNPLDCNCKILWFREWLSETENSSVINLPKETKCRTPEKLKNQALIDIDQSNFSCDNGAHPKLLLSFSSVLFQITLLISVKLFIRNNG